MKVQRWIVSVKSEVGGVWIPESREFASAEAAWNWARVNFQQDQFYISMVEREEGR